MGKEVENMMTKEQISKLTNVLIFKDGYHYITVKKDFAIVDRDPPGIETIAIRSLEECYMIVPEHWKLHNGFEFASDAYAYLVHLQTKKEKVGK